MDRTAKLWNVDERRLLRTIEGNDVSFTGGPLHGRVVDAQTGKPIAALRFALDDVLMPERSDADGRFSIAQWKPSQEDLRTAAAGYETEDNVGPLPTNSDVLIKLRSGGRVLRGQVTTEDGHPIAAAKVRPRCRTIVRRHSSPIPMAVSRLWGSPRLANCSVPRLRIPNT